MSYFELNETNDIQMLYDFNSNTHLFESIKQRKEKDQCDATAILTFIKINLFKNIHYIPLYSASYFNFLQN